MVVQASLLKSIMGVARAGGATFYNPAWHFLRGFYLLFLRVTLGASRLQEIMADHFAAVAYGASAFRDGLVHVVRRSLDWSKSVDVLVQQAEQHNRPLVSLYAAPEGGLELAELARSFEERMQDKGSPYDSHPPPGQRIAWVGRVPEQLDASPVVDGPTRDLFRDLEALEAEMTAMANARLAAQGVFSAPASGG
jgi:Zn-dependent protease with chaperone function